MGRLIKISKDDLFPSKEHELFPRKIHLWVDTRPYEADIDIVIGTYNQPDEVNATIENYLLLEKRARLHLWVVDESKRPAAFTGIVKDRRVSRVMVLDYIRSTRRKHAPKYWASNGASLAAQIGHHLGRARAVFFSHTDMMGYKPNFLSGLLAKLDENSPVASFTQRHLYPFTGGMVYDKQSFVGQAIDWLPKPHNPYMVPGLETFKGQISADIDTGEEFPLFAWAQGKRAYVGASAGRTGDYFGSATHNYTFDNQDVLQAGVPIDYAPLNITRAEFERRYPEFALQANEMWRKCFDDQGDVVFIHRGRGTTNRNWDDKRGYFGAFVAAFNEKIRMMEKYEEER